jgi:predicted O-methyltransferase YrrM
MIGALKKASRTAAFSVLKAADNYLLRHLSSAAPKLSEAIRKFPRVKNEQIITQIEHVRDRLLADNRPLVDHTLGDGGLYDQNVTTRRAAQASAPRTTLQFLFSLCREYQPSCSIELGTNVGISSAYLAAAMNTGTLQTLEASPYRLRIAQSIHKELGIGRIRYSQGLFTDTLESVLNTLDPIDMAFVDGHHQFQPTLDYFDAIWRRSKEGCIFIFDDIRWSEGMKQAWKILRADPRMTVAVDLRRIAVCVTTRSPSSRRPAVFSPRWVLRS